MGPLLCHRYVSLIVFIQLGGRKPTFGRVNQALSLKMYTGAVYELGDSKTATLIVRVCSKIVVAFVIIYFLSVVLELKKKIDISLSDSSL